MSLARVQLSSRLYCVATPKLITSATRTFSHSTRRCAGEPTPDKTSPKDPPGDLQASHESGLVRRQGPSEGLPRHQPDWDAPVDSSTSNFSPVPRRVMDGSEPGDVTAAAVLSGAPVDLQARTVRIYRPAKTATQSGTWHQHQWRMDWDVLAKGHRWENPLMGWQSSSDAMQGTHLNFKSKDDAILFANKQGYEYFVQEPNERRIVPKAYANNFIYDKGMESKNKDALGSMRIKHIKTK